MFATTFTGPNVLMGTRRKPPPEWHPRSLASPQRVQRTAHNTAGVPLGGPNLPRRTPYQGSNVPDRDPRCVLRSCQFVFGGLRLSQNLFSSLRSFANSPKLDISGPRVPRGRSGRGLAVPSWSLSRASWHTISVYRSLFMTTWPTFRKLSAK